jgi:hypothetical protein
MYTYTTANGYTITGTCVAACAAVDISLTGTIATLGTTCSSTVYGNVLFTTSHGTTITFNLVAMFLSSIMGTFLALK